MSRDETLETVFWWKNEPIGDIETRLWAAAAAVGTATRGIKFHIDENHDWSFYKPTNSLVDAGQESLEAFCKVLREAPIKDFRFSRAVVVDDFPQMQVLFEALGRNPTLTSATVLISRDTSQVSTAALQALRQISNLSVNSLKMMPPTTK
jgi:hypothetical protein